MRILAIDPGSEKSANLLYDCKTHRVLEHDISSNYDLANELMDHDGWAGEIVIEMMRARGMPTANEELMTCVWIGRFIQASQAQVGYPSWSLVYRKDVKLHLCGSMRAKDSNIRQALIDRFGGKDKAIGKKANPGPLYGIKKDLWQALAVAVTFADLSPVSEEGER